MSPAETINQPLTDDIRTTMPRSTDKQSVRDALQGKDIATLKESLTNLATQMTEGFKGVHARQDIANGKVGKLQVWQGFIKGGLAVLAIFIVPLIIYIAMHLN